MLAAIVKSSARDKAYYVMARGISRTLPAMPKGFHEQVMKTFAQRLRKAREAAGFEHAKHFADALGVEPAAYRYWERGGASPNLSMLTRICQLLDVEPNDLLPLARKRHPSKEVGRSVA